MPAIRQQTIQQYPTNNPLLDSILDIMINKSVKHLLSDAILNTALICQGKAKIFTKYLTKNSDNQTVENEVFYNPIQTFNRDMTLLVVQQYIDELREEKKKQEFEGVRIVDALSASGLRTIRFLQELDGVKEVYANDISEASHKLMADNFKLNELDQSRIKATIQDANVLLRHSKLNHPFDVVDLDPYGSVVPFLESSLESIKDGGLLCATCTDTRVLCGPDLHKCSYYYGTTRAKVHCFQQNAIRIVLNTINTIANKHCRYIQPIFSFQTEFYLRVFVRVHRDKTECANSGLKVGTVYNCNSCGNYEYQTNFTKKQGKLRPKPSKLLVSGPNCSVCGEPYFLNGPIWLGPLNSQHIVHKMFKRLQSPSQQTTTLLSLKTTKQIYGMLHAIIAEGKQSQTPLGLNLQLMSKNIRAQVPPKKVMMGAIQSLGFRLTNSYIHQGLYKTNASIQTVYDVLKQWKIHKTGVDSLKHNVKEEYSLRILEKPSGLKLDWGYELKEVVEHVPQFFPHLEKGMGPKGQAKKKIIEKSKEQEKGIKQPESFPDPTADEISPQDQQMHIPAPKVQQVNPPSPG